VFISLVEDDEGEGIPPLFSDFSLFSSSTREPWSSNRVIKMRVKRERNSFGSKNKMEVDRIEVPKFLPYLLPFFCKNFVWLKNVLRVEKFERLLNSFLLLHYSFNMHPFR